MSKYINDLSFSEQILEQLEKIKKSLESEMSDHISIGINSEYIERLNDKNSCSRRNVIQLPQSIKESNAFDQSEYQSTGNKSEVDIDLTDFVDKDRDINLDLNEGNKIVESMTMNNLPLDITSITGKSTIYSESNGSVTQSGESKNKKYKFVK